MSREYRVCWDIDTVADSPEAAAEKALEIQRNKDSIATCFDVVDLSDGQVRRVDLTEGASDPIQFPETQERLGYGTLKDLQAERFPSYAQVRSERFLPPARQWNRSKRADPEG